VEDGEENEIDEEDPEDQDDDEEVEKPRKRARKSPPTQGRRRAPASKANGVSKTGKAEKPRKSRKSDAAQVEENTNESPMLGTLIPTLHKKLIQIEALLDDKVALDATILEWIERYEDDKTAAMTEMINFILRVRHFILYILTSSAVDVPLKSVLKTSMTKITSPTPSPKSKKPTKTYPAAWSNII
jgi:cohesin complex subunit SA-1/2